MMKRLLAALAIAFAMFVWFMAANAGDRANQDWAPIGTVLFGLPGGIVLVVIAIVTSVDLLKKQKQKQMTDRDETDPSPLVPELCLLNAGWILCAFAVLKVVIFD